MSVRLIRARHRASSRPVLRAARVAVKNNGADGISDIEGKAARVAASERGQRGSFKLVINGVEQFCSSHNIDLTSVPALLGVELCVYIVATMLFLTVERPFLQ